MNLAGLPYAIDLMRLADIATVSRLEQDIFTMAWPESSFRFEVTQNKASDYFVLRYRPPFPSPENPHPAQRPWRLFRQPGYDDTLIGYGGIWMVLDEGHICTLAIRKDWRGLGLGELLLASLIESALRQKMELITLEVRVTNRAAQSLYRKYGFERSGMRRRYYIDNGEDALIMTAMAVQAQAYQRRFEQLTVRLRTRLASALEQSRADNLE